VPAPTLPSAFFGLVQSDLENALNVATVLGIYDDGNGVVNQTALAACADRGENELISWIVSEFGWPMPPAAQNDPLLKYSALDYWIAYSIERHPEYCKQAGLGTKESYFARATARAGRILTGLQNPTTAAAETPRENSGGVTVDGSTRLYIPNADGSTNAGDY
jgi:hypothetical protein